MNKLFFLIIVVLIFFDPAVAQKIHLFAVQTNGAPALNVDDSQSETEDMVKVLKNSSSLEFSTAVFFNESVQDAGPLMKELSLMNSRSDTADIVFLVWVGPWLPQPKSKTHFYFPFSKDKSLSAEYLLNAVDLLTAKTVVCVILSPAAYSFPFPQIPKIPLDSATGGKFILTFRSQTLSFSDQVGAAAELFDEAGSGNNSDQNRDGRLSVRELVTAIESNATDAKLRCTVWKISDSIDRILR